LAFANEIQLLISAPLVTGHGSDKSQEVKPLPVFKEVFAIEHALRQIENGIQIYLRLDIASTDGIASAFARTNRPMVLHYSGHGVATGDGGALLAEDHCGRARWLSSVELFTAASAARTPPCALAVLNACHTEPLAQALIDSGVQHVVCVDADERILDVAAHAFARHFYPPLLQGRSVADAFSSARYSLLNDDSLHVLSHQLGTLSFAEATKFRLLPSRVSDHLEPLDWADVRGPVVLPKWRSTNIPAVNADPFVGRQADISAIALRIAEGSRCVLLEGMGGMGKTALAWGVARWYHERRRFDDGVWFLSLRHTVDCNQALDRFSVALADVLDTQTSGSVLNALVVLDDVDSLHLSDEEGLVRFVKDLLGRRGTTVLLTARRDLPGDIVYDRYEVHPIADDFAQQAFQLYGPPPSQWRTDPVTFSDEWSRLTRLLGGYPFPIRLAATYMKQTRCSLHDLVDRLDADMGRVLQYPESRRSRDTSLIVTLDLSYDVLPAPARETFARLSLFPAGLTDESGVRCLGSDAVESLEALLRYSMAEMQEMAAGRRFTLPEPARRYAEERLVAGAKEYTYARALPYFQELGSRLREVLALGGTREARQLFLPEQLNILAVLDWALRHESVESSTCRSARLTGELAHYWAFAGTSEEPRALVFLQRATALARQHDDNVGLASVLRGTADIQQSRRHFEEALKSYEDAYKVYSLIGDRLGAGDSVRGTADILRETRNLDAALEKYHEAASQYSDGAHWSRAAMTYRVIGDVQMALNSVSNAIDAYDTSAGLFERSGHAEQAALTHKSIAEIEWRRRCFEDAERRFKMAVAIITNTPGR
jgi:tetratricopeptide (TPR) repeat protein